MEGVWSAENAAPGEIEAALRELLKERHARDQAYVPARVLNLVLVVDREWRGEIVNRLERVGRYHPSRTVLCEVEPGRTTLDARITTTVDDVEGLHVAQERVEIVMGTDHLPALDTIVDPLVVTDLATLVWSPHGHSIESLMKLAQVVLLDSLEAPDLRDAVRSASEYTERAYVVDLAWLRTTPWRERISATFDPPAWRTELEQAQLGDRPAPPRLRHVGAAAVRLAGIAARLGAGEAR